MSGVVDGQHAGTPAATPPVTFTTVQPPVTAPANPLLDLSSWSPLLAIIGAMAIIVGLFTKHVTGKIADAKEKHDGVHTTLDHDVQAVVHKLNNERQRINALEQFRGQDVERIVRLETNMTAMKDGQDRIERSLAR